MKDKFAREIMPGDEVVYAVRDGDTAALRYSIVNEVFDDKVQVRTQGGEGSMTYIRHPDRVAIVFSRPVPCED
jgi:hypothetical protein